MATVAILLLTVGAILLARSAQRTGDRRLKLASIALSVGSLAVALLAVAQVVRDHRG